MMRPAAALSLLLALLAAPPAFAQDGGMPNALQGFSRNKNEPVKIEANKLEVHDKDKLAIFTGNVFVQQGDTTMRSPELRVYYEGDTSKGAKKTAPPTPVAASQTTDGKVAATESNVSQKIKKIEALGGVIVTSKDQKATGDRADFEMKENVVTLTGNVVVSQGQNVMRGDRLVVELSTSQAHMEAGTKGKPGRVQGLFVPSDKGGGTDAAGNSGKGAKPESGKKKHKPQGSSGAISPVH